MKKNDAVKKHCCELCNYSTNRPYDLKRHQNAKHYTDKSIFTIGRRPDIFTRIHT